MCIKASVALQALPARCRVGLQCRGAVVSVDLAHLPSLEYGHGYRQLDLAYNSC